MTYDPKAPQKLLPPYEFIEAVKALVRSYPGVTLVRVDAEDKSMTTSWVNPNRLVRNYKPQIE